MKHGPTISIDVGIEFVKDVGLGFIIIHSTETKIFEMMTRHCCQIIVQYHYYFHSQKYLNMLSYINYLSTCIMTIIY